MAEGEKVGSVYVSVGIEADDTLRTLQAIEESLARIEGKKLDIGGSQRPPTQPNPNAPNIAHDTRQAPPPAGSGQRVVTPVDLQVNANKIADQIQAVLSGKIFDIRVRIANLQDIEAQLGEISVSVRAEAAKATGQSSGGGGSASIDASTITSGLNEKMAKALKGLDTDLLTRSLNEILEATGKSVTVSTRPGQDPTIEQQRTFIAKALQELGVAGKSAGDAFGRIQGELKRTGQYSDVAIRNLMQAIGYTPAGTYRDDGSKTTKNAYGGVLRVAQHVTPETVQTATPAPTSTVRQKPIATTTTTPVRQQSPDMQRISALAQQEALMAAEMSRIERESPAAERIPLSGGPSRGVLPQPLRIGSPRDSRGARRTPGMIIDDPLRGPITVNAVQGEGGAWHFPAKSLERINAARAAGIPVRSAMVHARHGMYQDPDTGELVMSPYGGSENAAGRTRTAVVDPAAEFQGQQNRAVQIAMHGGQIGGRPLIGQLAAAILEGQADYPGVVLKDGKPTDIGVQVPLITESTADLPGFAGKEMLGRPLFGRRGWMNVEGFDAPQQVQRLGFRQWVERQVMAELGPAAMDDPEIAQQVAELTGPNGFLSRVMQTRRAASSINPRSVLAPGGPGTPGPHQSAASPAGSEGAGISPTKLAKEMAEGRRYGIMSPESGFIEIEDRALRDAMSSMYPLAEVMPHPDDFGGRPTKAVYEKVYQGKGDEATWTLAGFRATGERDEEALAARGRASSREARMRALRSAYPQAFDAEGKPDPRFITDDAMLTPEAATELPLTQLRRVAAADIESREVLGMSPEENELFELAQGIFERVSAGDVGTGRAPTAVGRFRKGQLFSEGPNGAEYSPVMGAYDYALQEALNAPGGIFDRMGVEDRPQTLSGIINWAKRTSPLGREVLAPAMQGYLGFLQNRNYFAGQDQAIRAKETSAGRQRLGTTDPYALGRSSSRTQGRKINPKTGKPYRDNTGDFGRVPEFIYNVHHGPMAEALAELDTTEKYIPPRESIYDDAPKEAVRHVGLKADLAAAGTATAAADELAAYQKELSGRMQARGRAAYLRSKGLSPDLTDAELARGEEYQKGTGKYRTYYRYQPNPKGPTHAPVRRLYRGELTETAYRPYDYDPEEMAAAGAAQTPRRQEQAKLARLQAAARAEQESNAAAKASAQAAVEAKEAEIDRMSDIAHHAYAKADRLMMEHGPGYKPEDKDLTASVLSDPRIPKDLRPDVAAAMVQQMARGGGGMVQAFGELTDTATGPLDRRRADVTEKDKGLREHRYGSLVYDRTTKGRDLPTGDEVVANAARRAGVVMPGQTEESKAAVKAEIAAAAGEAAATAAAKSAGAGAEPAAAAAERSAGGFAMGGGTVKVHVVNWPSGFGRGGSGSAGGDGGEPPVAEGDEPMPGEPEERGPRAILSATDAYGTAGRDTKERRLQAQIELEARERRWQERSAPYASWERALGMPVTGARSLPYDSPAMATLTGEQEKEATARQREIEKQEREAAVARRKRERSGISMAKRDLRMEARTFEPEYADTMAVIRDRLQVAPGADLTAAQQELAFSAYPDAKALVKAQAAQKAAQDKQAQQAKASANKRSAAQVSTDKRVQAAEKRRMAAEESLRYPTSRREIEARMQAQGIPTEGPPYGFPPEALTPETYALSEAAPMMQEVRAAVRTARGRNPQRALGTTMIQLAQNTIGNADAVNAQLAEVEQRNQILNQMGREYGRIEGDTAERQKLIAGITESRAFTSAERDVAFRDYKAARKAGDEGAAAEARATFAELTKTIEEDTLAIDDHEKQIKTNNDSLKVLGDSMKSYGEETIALARDAGKASNVLRNLGAGFVGGIAGGIVTMGVSTAVQAVLAAAPMVIEQVDKAMGSGMVASRTQRELASVYSQSGYSRSALQGQYVQAGLTVSALDRMAGTVDRNAMAIAQAEQLDQQLKFLKTEQAVMKQIAETGIDVPPALGRGTGAFFSAGTPFGFGIDIGGTDSPAKMLAALINEAGSRTGEGLAYENPSMPDWMLQRGRDELESYRNIPNSTEEQVRRLMEGSPMGWTPDQLAQIYGEMTPELIAAMEEMPGRLDDVINAALEDVGSPYRLQRGDLNNNLADEMSKLGFQWEDLRKALEGNDLTVTRNGRAVTGIEDLADIFPDLAGRLSPTAWAKNFFDSASYNNTLWGMGQRFELQNEQMRLTQGLAAAGQRPLQFGIGIGYRPGGPGPTAGLNNISTRLDERIMAGSQQALDDLVNIYGVSQDLVDEFAMLGQKTQDWATQIGEIQSAQGLRNFNIQLIKANQSMADLRGLMGEQGGSEIGMLQRANVLLQRRAQLLQFEMQQRKINFSIAMAGFQSIGLTGEERAANIRIAKKEAAFQQEQLGINRQIFGNNVQLFDAQNIRNFRNLARDINNLIKTYDENTKVAELNQAIGKATRRQDQLSQRISTMLSQEMEVINLQNQIIEQMANDTNKKLTLTNKMEHVSATLKQSVNKIAQAIERADEIIQESEQRQREQQRSDDFDEMNGVDEGDQAGARLTGGKEPVVIHIHVAGHVVDAKQLARIVERELGEQGALQGLNT